MAVYDPFAKYLHGRIGKEIGSSCDGSKKRDDGELNY